MSDRKYRQRGYQQDDRDRDRDRGPRPPQAPRPDGPRERPEAPRTPNLMASHQIARCRSCAQILTLPIGLTATCPKCRADLHACAQCNFFDPGARFQCMQPLAAAVTPKDAANACQLFEPPLRFERQTSSGVPENSAKKAFDDLFKF